MRLVPGALDDEVGHGVTLAVLFTRRDVLDDEVADLVRPVESPVSGLEDTVLREGADLPVHVVGVQEEGETARGLLDLELVLVLDGMGYPLFLKQSRMPETAHSQRCILNVYILHARIAAPSARVKGSGMIIRCLPGILVW